MQSKKFIRVAAALVCGAIVASTVSVSAAEIFTPEYIESHGLRLLPVNVAETENGTIEVIGIEEGKAYTTSKLTVKLIPDEGCVIDPIFNSNLHESFDFTTGTWVDREVKKEADGVYTFEMPWVGDEGITITANFVTKEEAAKKEEQAAEEAAKEQAGGEGVVISDGKYLVPVKVAEVANGKIEVSCTEAKPEDVVTVKLIPDEGFVIAPTFSESIQREFAFTTGNPVDQFIEGENGVYTFPMPWDEAGVTISANFIPAK